MGDFKLSASAEANGVKISDVSANASLNVNNHFAAPQIDTAKPSLLGRAISEVRRAVNPTAYAEEMAAAMKIKADAETSVYNIYRQNMPFLTEKQAFLFANGYVSTPEQALNVFDVFESAERMLPEPDAYPEIAPAMLDGIIEGSRSAYDQELREIWASLLASEIKKPGETSRKTLRILSEMGKEEALVFMKVCSFATYDQSGKPGILFLVEDNRNHTTYNEKAVTHYELCMLESLGLYVINAAFYPPISSEESLVMHLSDKAVRISLSEGEHRFSLPYGAFTEYGCELAAICNVPSAPNLQDIIKRKAEAQGFTFSVIDKAGLEKNY
ncbi:DUF2806 domain-containing protein [uncultured Adlercreutzia sp.]|uniref:DUF2806 domain-containing protein n=1 Tax=uncultured Adlercreutzia sp. TaxID=875803 RepID=UPI0025F5CD0F|nr:DUF2806 domain-containing protein [uncultured Adlercreutzia sp.]